MKQQKKGNAKRTVLIVLCVFLSLVLATMIFATAYVENLLNKIDRDITDSTLSSSELEAFLNPEQPTGTGVFVGDDEINFGGEPVDVIGGEKIINILLIGQDRRSGTQRSLSDAMILCTVNKQNKTLTMTSFLRDMYVQIPGHGNNKINVCYPVGGMPLLDECLKVNFGIDVDSNVEVDFSGFKEIVDLAGGVTITLTRSEAMHLNKIAEDNDGGSYEANLREGENHLTGAQALAYSRIRYIGTDFGRTERQRNVITALLQQMKGMNLLELNALINEAVTYVTTDMTNAEIAGYVLDFFPLLGDLTINTQYVPVADSYRFGDAKNAVDCIFLDFEVNRKMLAETLLP